MHAACLHRSSRLQRVHALLSDGAERSTQEIMAGAHVCAVNSCIAELRAHPNNCRIDCRQQVNRATGQRTWLYRMVLPTEDAA